MDAQADEHGVKFRQSTRCDGGHCLEVGVGDAVYVRDSKEPEQAPIGFDRDAWRKFLAGIRV